MTELVGRSAQRRQVQNTGSEEFKEAGKRSPQHIGENPCECSEYGKACRIPTGESVMGVSKNSLGVSADLKCQRVNMREPYWPQQPYTISRCERLLAHYPFHRDPCLSCVLGSDHTHNEISLRKSWRACCSRPEFDNREPM